MNVMMVCGMRGRLVDGGSNVLKNASCFGLNFFLEDALAMA